MSDEYVPRYTAGIRMILDVLATADGPVWGKKITHLTGLKSGSVYPALARLENAGWVESRWEQAGPGLGRPARHYYVITEAGRARRDIENARLVALADSITRPAGPEPAQPHFLPGTGVPFRPAV